MIRERILYIVLAALHLSALMSIPYPDFDVLVNSNPYQESIFIHTSASETQFMGILDPDLEVSWYIVSVDGKGWDFKVNNNDKISYFMKPSDSWTPSGGGLWYVMGRDMKDADTLMSSGDFEADYHDIQYTQSGGYILQAYGKAEIDIMETSHLDTANILIIQEFDEQHNLIMEWRNYEHMDIQGYIDHLNLSSPYLNWMHGNSIEIDDDENIFISNRAMSEIIKFDRLSGNVIWRLGGPMNDFIFIDDPLFGPNRQHDARRLSNGNIMIFDNGDQRENPLTRISEYQIDEINMTARLVWSFSHPSGYLSLNQGCAQRLPNGNTLISWGGVSGHGQLISEVEPDGTIALELEYPQGHHSYKVRKSSWEFDIALTIADINMDESIDLLDILLAVNFILSELEPDPFMLFKADVDRTGEVDVSDIIQILDIII